MNAGGTPSASQSYQAFIDDLAVADPEAARRLAAHLAEGHPSACTDCLGRAVNEVVEALAIEITYGRELADGIGQLLTTAPPASLNRYFSMVKTAAAKGPTLATLFAQHLAPVMACGDTLLFDRFENVTRIMLKKGTYTLKAPLEALSTLVETRELACAHAFLDLLAATYSLSISYNRTVYLTHNLPQAVSTFSRSRRIWQINGLARTISEDERLFDPYLRGMASGLQLLSEAALKKFMDMAIRRHRKNHDSGARWFALESREAQIVCADLQVAVPLSSVQADLERYLLARTGLGVSIRPLSALHEPSTTRQAHAPMAFSDGRTIYLPDEMDLLERRAENAAIYKLLVKLEAGAFEFGTFDLDLDKALDAAAVRPRSTVLNTQTTEPDLHRFLLLFDDPAMALDLFVLFEHARVGRRVSRRYPGLSGRICDFLTEGHLLDRTENKIGGTLYPLYRHLVLKSELKAESYVTSIFNTMADRFNQMTVDASDTAETSVHLVLAFYPQLKRILSTEGTQRFQPLALPLGRRFDPSLFGPFHRAYHRLATNIQAHLKRRNVTIYRSDLRDLLIRSHGQTSIGDIQELIIKPAAAATDGRAVKISRNDIESLICDWQATQTASDVDGANAFRYREWDWCMGEYLSNRVRVLERTIQTADPAFYRQTLNAFHGLVKRIRYAFELLRPEEMTIFRQWPEGDAFDYRALLDYALDKKAGLMPSERLFIKRLKKVRDVAALLLVDLSKSTANTVDDRGTRVLDVEKQAIVMFCEALAVVGDRFAIAGFSGTGPLGVDYYRVKDINEPFDDSVQKRIGAMSPQRSTRMGAAIRHATAQIVPVQARVKLIVIISDGYPNDLAYKGSYAVEDTRRAVMEARTAGVHVKAITVNINDNGQLDRLYGKSHHTRIGDIRDLPDRLVRVYSAMTRH